MSNRNFIICPIDECTGCASCINVCNHNAIKLYTDKYGFKYPHIDKNSCINCKKCIKHCPSLSNKFIDKNVAKLAYACYNNIDNERIKSSSGGLAFILAKNILKNNGVVYGCSFVPPFNIQHVRCTSIEDIERIRGSKYVQSDISNIYTEIEKDLKEEKKVLFIGTPCQVAGIKSCFFKTDNLYTVDIICHGTPSLKYLKETLAEINTPIYDIQFRNNNKFIFTLKNNNNENIFIRDLNNDLYMKGFFNGTTFRPCCYTCKYACNKRISDITIGDFWGVKSDNISNPELGVSLALINTNKGEYIFNQCKNNLYYEKQSIDTAIKGNEQLRHPYNKNFRSTIFRFFYPKIGYKNALICALPDKILAMRIKNLLKKKSSNDKY